MKKIVALAVIAATLFSLSACKVRGNMTPEERESSRVEMSLKIEREYVEGVNETVEDVIGKTKKGERLVIKGGTALGHEYTVYIFDKKEKLKDEINYQFFDFKKNYEATLEIKETGHGRQIDHDDKARMVVYKKASKDLAEDTFDSLYEAYSNPRVTELGYIIVE
jgi:hypothetical protein